MSLTLHKNLEQYVAETTRHIQDILTIPFEYRITEKAVVVFDTHSELSSLITHAYQLCLPHGQFIDFDESAPELILQILESLQPKDLVVLVQSTSFRLEAYRIRVELFKRDLKVIEHPHLLRMNGPQIPIYINSLEYDPKYYRVIGPYLKQKIDSAKSAKILSGTFSALPLHFDGPFEDAKLNIGDYTGMKNVGWQYPIGEVFTEAKILEAVNGEVRIFAFADLDFTVNKPQEPITLVVSKGRISSVINSTPQFDLVLDKIRADEGEVWIRELGFGMNRAFSHERVVTDVGTMERMCGIHISLGGKHLVYRKIIPSLPLSRYHVDVFVAAQEVYLDSSVIFSNGEWVAE